MPNPLSSAARAVSSIFVGGSESPRDSIISEWEKNPEYYRVNGHIQEARQKAPRVLIGGPDYRDAALFFYPLEFHEPFLLRNAQGDVVAEGGSVLDLHTVRIRPGELSYSERKRLILMARAEMNYLAVVLLRMIANNEKVPDMIWAVGPAVLTSHLMAMGFEEVRFVSSGGEENEIPQGKGLMTFTALPVNSETLEKLQNRTTYSDPSVQRRMDRLGNPQTDKSINSIIS